MPTAAYDSVMAVDRNRPSRNVTLNPVLVDEFKASHKAMGETAFSRMLEAAMKLWLEKHPAPPKVAGHKRKAGK